MKKQNLLLCTCEEENCKYDFITNSIDNLDCPKCGSEKITGNWKKSIVFNKEHGLTAYILTEIKVEMDEICEHETKLYINTENIEDIYNTKVDNWINEIEENAEDNGEEFDFESWVIENLKHDINTKNYKCKHFISGDGSEKIFELKTHTI